VVDPEIKKAMDDAAVQGAAVPDAGGDEQPADAYGQQ
jgi:hypothetical protein